MLGFFKRYRSSRQKLQPFAPYSYLTACEYVKPMSRYDYESANQSLGNASNWLTERELKFTPFSVSRRDLS